MGRQNILALRRKMKEAAFNDPLTGGISNAAFLLRVQEKLEKEPQRPYVMAFLNIRVQFLADSVVSESSRKPSMTF